MVAVYKVHSVESLSEFTLTEHIYPVVINDLHLGNHKRGHGMDRIMSVSVIGNYNNSLIISKWITCSTDLFILFFYFLFFIYFFLFFFGGLSLFLYLCVERFI